MSKTIDLKTIYVVHFISSVIIIKILNCIFPSFTNFISLIVGHVVVFSLLAFFNFKCMKQILLNQRIQTTDKAVFITGCDRGFGYLLAKRLDSIGFKVFAGCLFPCGSGAQELNLYCSKRLKIVKLDVTNDESVKEAYEFVKNNLNGSVLWALVNNVGIRKGAGVEYTSLEDFKLCMDINCLGIIRVTMAFLPLIKKSIGRIVNLTCISSRIGFPRNIAYVTTKFAAAGFNDSLRYEYEDWGIRLIAIEPDIFQTPMQNMEDFDNMVDDCLRNLDRSIREDYGEEYFEALKESTRKMHNTASSNTNLVIDDIESAISLTYPDKIYRPSGSWMNKLFTNVYLVLSSGLQSILINFATRNFPKPKRLQTMFTINA